MAKITFHRHNRSLNVAEGTELVCLLYLDPTIPLAFGCRQGHCGTCAIKIIEGGNNLSPKTKQEKETLQRLKLDACRLGCQCAIKGDIVIDNCHR